ncbi:phytoene desaturase family protein [Nocardia sp. NPDC051750]|uniref:phytoene desaturase family protein n=1 Tax=Nocardia sp. NPDC051750 TaxID=3364325 RepID=UPI0037B001B6
MRQVTGRAGHIVVIGAGLAGLSAAIHLAGRGRAVTVLERDTVPGGRAGRADIGGCRLDLGPTVLTMPDLVDEVFAAVGENTDDHLRLVPVDPSYRARFADGRELDVHTGADRMSSAIADFAGPREAAGYRKLRRWLTRLYDTEFERFIATNIDSPASLLTPDTARLIMAGGLRRWDRAVADHLHDPDVRRLFTFQSLYAGVAPARALAAYAVIAYMDTIRGVFFPLGGMRALPDALATVATRAGVDIRYGTTVASAQRSGSRVRAVTTADGRRIDCDALVSTAELHHTYELLTHRSRRPQRPIPAPSAVVVHVSCDPAPRLAHHSLLFGRAWNETFDDLLTDGRPMRDPSLLLTRPTATDSTLAPPGRDLISVLAPAPNLARAPIDWDRYGPDYTEEILATVNRRLPTPLTGVEVLHVRTPADWARQGMLAGSPFALAHTLSQTGPLRPANMIRGLDNVVLAGSSTVPGVGIPPVLVSGRLAADRITGTVTARTALAAEPLLTHTYRSPTP